MLQMFNKINIFKWEQSIPQPPPAPVKCKNGTFFDLGKRLQSEFKNQIKKKKLFTHQKKKN